MWVVVKYHHIVWGLWMDLPKYHIFFKLLKQVHDFRVKYDENYDDYTGGVNEK